MKPVIYSRYNPPPARGVTFSEPTMTRQEFKDECDINLIVRRAARTGYLIDPSVVNPNNRPRFGDFSFNSDDFIDAQNMISDAHEMFDSLPADIRAEFANDPYRLLEAIEDPENYDRLVELRILVPREDSSRSSGADSEPEPGTDSGA